MLQRLTLALVLVLSGCATIDMAAVWDADNRILAFPSEHQAGAECYRRGIRVNAFEGAPAMIIACYDARADVIILSDYRIGVPTVPGILQHEQQHRADFKAGNGSWHR